MSQQSEKKYRYPGATPFKTEQANIFFGRDQDTDDLYRIIRHEPLVVLYGKSGFGKSSLINAGIIPLCGKEKIYAPVVVRFGSWSENVDATPLSIVKSAIITTKGQTLLNKLIPDDESLWRFSKNRQLIGGDKPLLLFDQFEELFSYPNDQIIAFQQELSELLNTSIPLRFRRLIDEARGITDEEEEALEKSLETRIVFAIRSDRMHLLDRLATYLPNILRNCFELKALKKGDAQSAILSPALTEGDFATPTFEYSNIAVENLLKFLEDGQERRVEGILLQMLCEHFERNQVAGQGKLFLDLQEIGNPDDIVKNYYEEKLEDLTDHERKLVRLLIEEGLVSEGEAMRLSLHEANIAQEFKINKSILEKLVDSRLLRSEPFLRGGYTYELSHDRLIKPVINSREKRRNEEQDLENKRLKGVAEQERRLKEKAQGQLRLVRLLLIVSVIAFALAIYMAYNSNAQRNAAKEAQQKTQQAYEKVLQAEIQRSNAEKQKNDEMIKNYLERSEQFLGINKKAFALENLRKALKLDSARIDIILKIKTLESQK